MLFNLIKKDFILSKKYLLALAILAVAFPMFAANQVKVGSDLNFLILFATEIYAEYLFIITLAMFDYKYKGASLLCTTPYTRSSIIKSRYIFMLIIFLSTYFIYLIDSLILPKAIHGPDFLLLSICFLGTCIFLGILIPIQYRFGYQKLSYIMAAFILLTPIIAPKIYKIIVSNINIFKIRLSFSQGFEGLLLCLIGLVIWLASMFVSINIYSRKDL